MQVGTQMSKEFHSCKTDEIKIGLKFSGQGFPAERVRTSTHSLSGQRTIIFEMLIYREV